MRMTTFTVLAAVAALAGCSADAPPHRDAELQAELDRLENEIGKLEFRVYELEQALMAPAADAAPAADKAPPATDGATAEGRYDLTPVE